MPQIDPAAVARLGRSPAPQDPPFDRRGARAVEHAARPPARFSSLRGQTTVNQKREPKGNTLLAQRYPFPDNSYFWRRAPLLFPQRYHLFPVLSQFEAAEFDLRIGQWMVAQEISILQGLAVDGKCLRGSGRTDGKALPLLSAVSHRLRLTVAQEPIQEKSHEIPALKPLLQQLPKGALEGGLITADALHCQQESARFITQELGTDYLFGLITGAAGYTTPA